MLFKYYCHCASRSITEGMPYILHTGLSRGRDRERANIGQKHSTDQNSLLCRRCRSTSRAEKLKKSEKRNLVSNQNQ